jgi:hypothetical protein
VDQCGWREGVAWLELRLREGAKHRLRTSPTRAYFLQLNSSSTHLNSFCQTIVLCGRRCATFSYLTPSRCITTKSSVRSQQFAMQKCRTTGPPEEQLTTMRRKRSSAEHGTIYDLILAMSQTMTSHVSKPQKLSRRVSLL